MDADFCESGLTEISIPDSVTTISCSAFSGLWQYGGLDHLKIGRGVRLVGEEAFSFCWAKDLPPQNSMLVVPETCTIVEPHAFSGIVNQTAVIGVPGGSMRIPLQSAFFYGRLKDLFVRPGTKLVDSKYLNSYLDIGFRIHADRYCEFKGVPEISVERHDAEQLANMIALLEIEEL